MAQPLEPEHIERELLRVVRDEKVDIKNGRKQNFKRLCDTLLDDDGHPIFGISGSALRRRVQKRRAYLQARPRRFHSAVASLLESPQPAPSDNPPSSSNRITRTPAFSPPPKLNLSSVVSPSSSKMPTINEGPFQLFLDQAWANEYGIVATIASNVEIEDSKVVDVVRVFLPFHCVEDYRAKLFGGRLSDDGGGIWLTMPAVQHNMRNAGTMVAEADKMTGRECDGSRISYELQTAAMERDVELCKIEREFRFPEGTTCNNKAFNGKQSDDFSLKMNFGMTKKIMGEGGMGDSEKFFSIHPFLLFEMVIDEKDGNTRYTKNVTDEDVDDVADALRDIGITSPAGNGGGGGSGTTYPY